MSYCLSFSQANHGGIHGSLPPELKALGAEPSEVELVASPEGDEESGKVQRGGPVCQGGGALHRNWQVPLTFASGTSKAVSVTVNRLVYCGIM